MHQTFVSRVSRVSAIQARRATLLLAAVVVSACSDDDAMGPETGTGATLQVINGATQAVDVRVDGTLRASNVTVGALSTALDVAPGSHAVQLTPTGTTTGGATVTVNVASDARSTVAATRASSGVSAVALADTGLLVGVGRSKLRVLHLASNAPALDIWRTQPDYQTPISIMFPYTYLSGATVESSAGTWEVRIWPTGGGSWTAAASSLSIPIGSGQLRTVVTLDAPGGGVKLQLLDP